VAHVRSGPTDARQLLAANGRPVADDRFLLRSPGSKTPTCGRGIVLTRRRRSPSIPKPILSTATRRNTRCMSVLNIASATCSPYSAAQRARSVRLTSTNASPPVPPSMLLQSDTRKLHAEDPDVLMTSRGDFASRPARSRCNRASTYGPRQRDPFRSVNFFNYNLDPTRRYGSETSASLRASDNRAVSRGLRLHPRHLSRRSLCRQ